MTAAVSDSSKSESEQLLLMQIGIGYALNRWPDSGVTVISNIETLICEKTFRKNIETFNILYENPSNLEVLRKR